MNSLRDEMKDAIAAVLAGGREAPESADYELAADIADEVFTVLGISEGTQDMPKDEAISQFKNMPEDTNYCDKCRHLGETTCSGVKDGCWQKMDINEGWDRGYGF